jgi:phosphatidate cytidylyltransferase
LKQRVLTGAVAGAAFLALLAWGGYAYAALIMLLAIIGYFEFVRMIGLKSFPLTALYGLVGTLLLTAPWSFFDPLHWPERGTAVIWLVVFGLLAVTVFTKNRIPIDQAALLFLGVVYLGFGFHYMIETRLPEHGLFWTLFVFVCIWVTDSGAYFVGSKLGKHPLWPAISPKKSVEGAAGGIAAAVAAAVIFALAAPERLTVPHAVWLGVVIGIVGQLGDLMQSAYKRVKGIKDTGTILPGHGGVLDRVDSWLIVFPFLHLTGLLAVS